MIGRIVGVKENCQIGLAGWLSRPGGMTFKADLIFVRKRGIVRSFMNIGGRGSCGPICYFDSTDSNHSIRGVGWRWGSGICLVIMGIMAILTFGMAIGRSKFCRVPIFRSKMPSVISGDGMSVSFL